MSKILRNAVLGLAILLPFPTLSYAQSGSSQPVPNPDPQSTVWQANHNSSSSSADLDLQFKSWQLQRTSADSINRFRCSTSTDLESPECVEQSPGTMSRGRTMPKLQLLFQFLKRLQATPIAQG